MSGFPTANFADTAEGLFSTAEIQRLMRIEYERAVRYDYPIALLLIEVDRIEYLHDLYGYESKEEILHSVIALLRSMTRASDFLGCMVGNRIMALLPHAPERAATALAGRLLRGSRRLAFESDGRSLRASLSIGVSVSNAQSEPDFDKFVQAALDGLRFAAVQGGDRYAVRETAKDLIEDLRREIDAEAQALLLEHEELKTLVDMQAAQIEEAEQRARRLEGGDGGPAADQTFHSIAVEPEAPPPPPEGDLPPSFLTGEIEELFRAVDPDRPDLGRLEQDVVALVEAGLQIAKDQALAAYAAEHELKVDVLERRVAKLKGLLDGTEAELKRIAGLKHVDLGMASIYRTVQGLSPEEEQYARKREMLSILFEANVELRRQIDERKGS